MIMINMITLQTYPIRRVEQEEKVKTDLRMRVKRALL